MELEPYINEVHRHFEAAVAAAGDEARKLAERLASALDAALRLSFQDVLAGAADEISAELAPGSVELRLRQRQPEFVVTLPPVTEAPSPALPSAASPASPAPAHLLLTPGEEAIGGLVPGDEEDSPLSRINLRLPESLKTRVERAAMTEGISVNSWLVRTTQAALERSLRPAPAAEHTISRQRFVGWAR
jgi:uncharacterized protein (DUF1778 family)